MLNQITRNEDTSFGRITYFGERMQLHPNVPEDSTSITLMRNEEMRYGVQLTRGDWSTFFSAREIRTIAEFVDQHRVWLEWGCRHNAGDQVVSAPDGYTAWTGDHDEDLSAYQLYSGGSHQRPCILHFQGRRQWVGYSHRHQWIIQGASSQVGPLIMCQSCQPSIQTVNIGISPGCCRMQRNAGWCKTRLVS